MLQTLLTSEVLLHNFASFGLNLELHIQTLSFSCCPKLILLASSYRLFQSGLKDTALINKHLAQVLL
jgi:hypothetical protein